MAKLMTIESWEELAKLLDSDGKLEIVRRRGNKRYREFVNVVLSDEMTQAKQSVKERLQSALEDSFLSFSDSSSTKVVKPFFSQINTLKHLAKANGRSLAKLPAMSAQGLEMIEQMSTQLTSLQSLMGGMQKAVWLGNALSAANLCTSMVGFAIISEKMDRVSEKIDELAKTLSNLDELTKDAHITQTADNLMRNAKLYLHNVNCGVCVSRKEFEQLIADYHSFIAKMFRIMDYCTEEFCQILYGILPGYVAVFTAYLEEYYGESVNEQNPLYVECQDIFAKLSNSEFYDRITDFYYLEAGLHNGEVNHILDRLFLIDVNLMGQIANTMDLLKLAGDRETYQELKEVIDRLVVKETLKIVLELQGGENPAEYMEMIRHAVVQAMGQKAANYAMEQMAVAQ